MSLNKFGLGNLWRMSAMRQTAIFGLVFMVALFGSNIISNQSMWNEITSQMQTSLIKKQNDYQKILRENAADFSKLQIHQDDFVVLKSNLKVNSSQFDQLGFFILDEEALEDLNINHQTYIKNAEGWYFLAKPYGEDVLIVGQDLTLVVEIMGEAHKSKFKFGMFAMFLALGIGGIIGLKNHKRLTQISQTLTKVAEGDFTQRLNRLKDQDDIDQLMHQIDEVLVQLELQFSQIKLLSSNIAHELKTPLSRLYIQIEQARMSDNITEIETLLTSSETEIQKMLKIFDGMIRIAKLESGQGQKNLQQYSLKHIIEEVVDTYEPVLEDRNVAILFKSDADLNIAMNEALIFQAISNLIENSLKHGQNLKHIWIEQNKSEFIYFDDGGGVEEAILGKLTDPLFQGELSRNQGGAGLGLALLNAICRHHDAALHIENCHNPHGLRVEINFKG